MTVFTATETTLSAQQSVGWVKALQYLQLGKTWKEKVFFFSIYVLKTGKTDFFQQ